MNGNEQISGPGGTPMKHDESMRIPPWMLPALMAFVGGGTAGYAGRNVIDEYDPAVVATEVRAMRAEIGQLREQVTAIQGSMGDRWTRSDQQRWIETEYRTTADRARQNEAAINALRYSLRSGPITHNPHAPEWPP